MIKIKIRRYFKSYPFFGPVLSGNFQVNKDENGILLLDLDPIIFNVVLKSTKRMSSLLRSLPKDRDIGEVFRMMDYLMLKLDVGDQWTLKDIYCRLKDNQTYVDKIARHCYETVKGNVPGAMDAATVLYLKLENNMIDWRNNTTKSVAYNLFLYVISHPRVFGPRIRHHLWISIKNNLWYRISPKQQAALPKWQPRNDRPDDESDYSKESDSEDDYYGSSDDDFF
ncbi:hypothetical protein PPL_10520 [Heterostelium album PN500]|uniref:Uncharacterized protein n=1 Tax=Heterostelium pallidum (strain ATCC 26659 / Pp 5 / PN500) TaxID=670386 RepID=D3BRB2_HETP5|nr:hypothetical protein PPL_10520 [Heterostelium album PN500]EFA75944.1 hypothetical protein PPL_10520 [Heterostelium album PN500]|eukprot:XP_020428078.1 hypothetical protein PPL_10520 [Heterostelium album PN500]